MEHPITSQPVGVGLASGWAQAIAKVYGDQPINASAWKTDMKLIRSHLQSQISPHLYEKEISRLHRKGLLKDAQKNTRLVRKAKEKARETSRNSIESKLQIHQNPSTMEIQAPLSSIEKDEEIEGFPTEWDEVKKKINWSDDFFKTKEG